MKKEDDKRVREDKTESQKLEKKLFAITAVLMCVLGAVLGLYAVEFLSVYFPNTNAVQYTLTCTITATILALVMLSLSKPVCKLLKMFMEKMQASLSTRPVYKSMSVVFGIIFGISSAILSGAALSVFVPRLPGVMYVFIIAIVFVVFTYIATVVFGKILGANAGSAVDYHRGYVIASSAFQIRSSSEKSPLWMSPCRYSAINSPTRRWKAKTLLCSRKRLTIICSLKRLRLSSLPTATPREAKPKISFLSRTAVNSR